LLSNLDKWFAGIPQMASGGVVKARPGGTLVNVGEAGRDEAIVPLGAGGGGAVNITINAGLGVDGIQLGRQIDQVLQKYYRAGGR